MLSLTSDDLPKFTYPTPEDMKGAQEKALNVWVGATSPLWAPFWLASTVGIGLWAMGQGFRRTRDTLNVVPELYASVETPSATDVAGTVQTMVDDGVIAPMQAAGKAIQDMTTAVTPSPQAIVDQINAAGDEATAKAADLAEAATSTVDEATTRAVEQAEAQVDAQAEAVADVSTDAGSLFPVDVASAGPAAAAVAADTAIAESDAVRPALRKPRKT